MNLHRSERVAWITGAAGGLGGAMTGALLADGHKVVAMDSDGAALERLKERHGGESAASLLAVQGDVASEDDCNRAAAEGLHRFGRIEIVVNNAGIGPSHIRPDAESRLPAIMELEPEVWSRFFAVNVLGAIQVTRAALPSMKAGGWGRIVNNTTSFFTMMRVLPYGATKSALESLSTVWAKELEDSGISVNVLIPGGPVDTPFIAEESGIPRAGMLQPDIMAGPIRWLASDESRGFNNNRIVAAKWESDLPPTEAAIKACDPIGWHQLAANVVWPDD